MGRSQFQRFQKSDVLHAGILLGVPSFVKARRKQGRKGLGLRYEEKVQGHLKDEYPNYVASPWFQYRLRDAPNRINYAQPDGLLIDVMRGLVTIIEVKYSHTVDAYYQLYDKYLPLVEHFFRVEGNRLWSFAVVEVVRWYDCATAYPCSVVLREHVHTVRPGEFAVHICRV